MEETLIISIAVVIGLVGLAAFVLGAIGLFGYAAEQEFLGIAAYIACWVFLAPIMATISVLFGLYLLFLIVKENWF